MHRKLMGLTLLALSAALGLRAAPVSRGEVLAAIAVLEKDVTSPDAPAAAEKVARYGRESDDVLLIIGPETLPWVRTDAPETEVRVRSILMAAYFAGDIKAQLRQGEARDDPYSGWLAAIRAYGQIRRKQPEITIPEIEDLIRKEHAGTLKADADAIRKEQQDEQEQGPRHLV